MISFTYTGYVVVDPSGGGKYGGRLTNIVSTYSGQHTLSLFRPGQISPTDFSIGFGPINTQPQDMYNAASFRTQEIAHVHDHGLANPYWEDTDSDSVYGQFQDQPDWFEGSNLFFSATDARFCIHVINNSGSPGVTGGNGTGSRLVGESLVARVDVVENLLFLGKYNQDPELFNGN
jgi:hypothetical protein